MFVTTILLAGNAVLNLIDVLARGEAKAPTAAVIRNNKQGHDLSILICNFLSGFGLV